MKRAKADEILAPPFERYALSDQLDNVSRSKNQSFGIARCIRPVHDFTVPELNF
jgi:hypothetical protein